MQESRFLQSREKILWPGRGEHSPQKNSMKLIEAKQVAKNIVTVKLPYQSTRLDDPNYVSSIMGSEWCYEYGNSSSLFSACFFVATEDCMLRWGRLKLNGAGADRSRRYRETGIMLCMGKRWIYAYLECARYIL